MALKYVASLDKPGGNVTGVLHAARPTWPQSRSQLLMEALPGRKRFAVAWDNDTAEQFAAVERAAKEAKLDLQPLRHERPPYSIELTFKNIVVRKSQMAMFLPSPHFGGRRSKIAELATARKLPTLFASKAYVESGGLMSLGLDYPAAMRKLAETDRQDPARREARQPAGRCRAQAGYRGQHQDRQGDRRRTARSGAASAPTRRRSS